MGDAVRRRSAVRGSIGVSAVFALVATLLTAFGWSATVTWAAAAAPEPRDKVQPKLLKSFETDPSRAFWIRFDQLVTGSDGRDVRWIDSRENPLRLIAAKDDYELAVRNLWLRAGATVEADFELARA
jgi:hypothetical protein